jgi:hypothetical protein
MWLLRIDIKHSWRRYSHLQLLEDSVCYPSDLGVESKDVDHTVSRRVRGGIRTRTELFAVLQGLLGLQYKRNEMGLL